MHQVLACKHCICCGDAVGRENQLFKGCEAGQAGWHCARQLAACQQQLLEADWQAQGLQLLQRVL
jgi:hypothetical protein